MRTLLFLIVAGIVSCNYSGTPDSTDSTIIIQNDTTVVIDSVVIDSTKQ